MAHSTLAHKGKAIPHDTTPPSSGYTPAQIRRAYGLDQLSADGTGQTIAIIGAYHDPNIYSEIQAFDAQFGLADPPSFQQVAQDGSTNYPLTAAAAGASSIWPQEAALDVEWAHAIAPGAKIILVEANSDSPIDLIGGAANWVRTQPGVSVVSMSFGSSEFQLQQSLDSDLTTPSGHIPITFVASSGDAGDPANYPAFSSNVVAVGGTSLSLDASGNFVSDVAWGGSGGGTSVFEAKPSYQSNVMPSSTKRTAPDVTLIASPGVDVYDSYDFGSSPWVAQQGTSVAAPIFAGMIALANQMRVNNGLATLNGRNDTLPMLYSAPASDFHDITQGGNGTDNAGVGYDLATGWGSPVGNYLIPDLAGVKGSINGYAHSDNNGDGVYDAGDTPLVGARVYLDANNNGAYDTTSTQTFASGTLNSSIPDNSTTGVTSTLVTTGLGGPITHVSVTLSIAHNADSQLTGYLVAPDGTQIALFQAAGGSGHNFTNTTFDDGGATIISSGTAPFTGTYRPKTALSTFNSKSPTGNWSLVVTDTKSGTVGTLTSWSLALTAGPEVSALTGADGSYSFTGLATGSYTVRVVAPANALATAATSFVASVHANSVAGVFLFMPLAFTAAGPNNTYYLWQDANNYLVGAGTSATAPVYELPKSLVSSLTFNLAGSQVYVDYSAGPIAANINVNGGGLASSELVVHGAGATVTTLTMTDTQLSPATGGIVTYTNLGTLSLWYSTVNYSGNLSTLQYLNVDSGTFFYWS